MRGIFILFTVLLFISSIALSQPTCNDDVIVFATSVDQQLDNLPTYTDDQEWKSRILAILNPSIKKEIQASVDKYNQANYSVSEKRCFNRQLSDRNLQWWAEFVKTDSPNGLFGRQTFRKANYLLLSWKPYGVTTKDEQYTSTIFLRYGRTFGKKETGLRFRGFIGGGNWHQQRNITVWSPSLQYNFLELQALGADFLTGVIEVNYLGGLNKRMNAYEVGISFETFFLNLNLISFGYQDLTEQTYFQSGIQIQLIELFKLF